MKTSRFCSTVSVVSRLSSCGTTPHSARACFDSPGQLVAEHLDLALVGDRLRRQQPHRGRLAGAVRAEQADARALGHVEVEAVDRGDRAVALDDPADADREAHRRRGYRAGRPARSQDFCVDRLTPRAPSRGPGRSGAARAFLGNSSVRLRGSSRAPGFMRAMRKFPLPSSPPAPSPSPPAETRRIRRPRRVRVRLRPRDRPAQAPGVPAQGGRGPARRRRARAAAAAPRASARRARPRPEAAQGDGRPCKSYRRRRSGTSATKTARRCATGWSSSPPACAKHGVDLPSSPAPPVTARGASRCASRRSSTRRPRRAGSCCPRRPAASRRPGGPGGGPGIQIGPPPGASSEGRDRAPEPPPARCRRRDRRRRAGDRRRGRCRDRRRR